MKTSIEIPDGIWSAAKIRAIRQRKSLSEVVSEALEAHLGNEVSPPSNDVASSNVRQKGSKPPRGGRK